MARLGADVREMLQEQWDYRELLLQMTRRDLMLRYKQTIMGVGWAVFMPLLNTAVFSVIFMRVAPLDPGVPYPAFAYCGLLAWNFFASSLRFAVNSLTGNITLVSKVYFPREIFPVSAVIVCLVDFAVAAIVLFALIAWYRIGLTAAVLFLPVVVAVQVGFTLAIGLLVAMANVFYRDVKYLFEIVLTVGMFATAVVYPTQVVGGRVGHLLQLNPMTAIIDAYRAVLLRGELPSLVPFGACALLATSILAAAWLLFHRAEFTFAENI
jgi:ABC-type polysaccharide/polyol phosphate export permease